MAEKEKSPTSESFHSFEIYEDHEAYPIYSDNEFFSDEYGVIDKVPLSELTENETENFEYRNQMHSEKESILDDDEKRLRAQLEAMSSYADNECLEHLQLQEQRLESSAVNAGCSSKTTMSSSASSYAPGDYLDSYVHKQPKGNPPDRTRQRELSLTRSHSAKRISHENVVEPDLGSQRKISLESESFDSKQTSFGSKLNLQDGMSIKGYCSQNRVQEDQLSSLMVPSIKVNAPPSSTCITSTKLQNKVDSNDENELFRCQDDQFERVSQETEDIIQKISKTLYSSRVVEHEPSYNENSYNVNADFRDDEDPFLQTRYSLEDAEMFNTEDFISPGTSSPKKNIRNRRSSFEQSGLETRYLAAELEDERTPSPDLSQSQLNEAETKIHSTMQKIENLLGSRTSAKPFLDTETIEEISTYGRIRKIKKQRSEDQRILDEFDRHFDLCFDDSGEEDEFVSIRDVDDVLERTAGRIPQDFYDAMVQQGPHLMCETKRISEKATNPGDRDKAVSPHMFSPSLLEFEKAPFDLRRSREMLDLVEASQKNVPIHDDRCVSSSEQLAGGITPHQSSNEDLKLSDSLVPVVTEFFKSPETYCFKKELDSSFLNKAQLRQSVENEIMPSLLQGEQQSIVVRTDEAETLRLKEEAQPQNIVPFDGSPFYTPYTKSVCPERPKAPVKAWRADLNLKTGEKMYESERYGGKRRSSVYGEVFGPSMTRKPNLNVSVYEPLERGNRTKMFFNTEPHSDSMTQKQKFVAASPTKISSAFSAAVVDSDFYADERYGPHSQASSSPRKSEKRRRRSSLQDNRSSFESRETPIDQVLHDSSERSFTVNENFDARRVQNWRAQFHQFPLSSESTEASQDPFNEKAGTKDTSNNYALESSSNLVKNNFNIPSDAASPAFPQTKKSRNSHNVGNFSRTLSADSVEEWSQSGYFIKPPPRKVRSRQSVASGASVGTDSLNIETVTSEMSSSRQPFPTKSDLRSFTGSLATPSLGSSLPVPPKRARSCQRSVNNISKHFCMRETLKGSQQLSNLTADLQEQPRALKRTRSVSESYKSDRNKASSASRTTQGDLDINEVSIASLSKDVVLPTSPGDMRKVINGATPPVGEKNYFSNLHKPFDEAVKSTNTPFQSSLAEKLRNHQSTRLLSEKSGSVTEHDLPEESHLHDAVENKVNFRDRLLSNSTGSSARSDTDRLEKRSDEEEIYSDEEISSSFTVTFKPGSKVAEIEETPVHSSKSSSRRSSNSGLEERSRSRVRRNQEGLLKALDKIEKQEKEYAASEKSSERRSATKTPSKDIEASESKTDCVSSAVVLANCNFGEKKVKTTSLLRSAEKVPDTLKLENFSGGYNSTAAESERLTKATAPLHTRQPDQFTLDGLNVPQVPKIQIASSGSFEEGYEAIDTNDKKMHPAPPQRRRRSSAGEPNKNGVNDIKIICQDKFGLVKPTYDDQHKWIRHTLSSDEELPPNSKPDFEVRLDKTMNAIDKIVLGSSFSDKSTPDSSATLAADSFRKHMELVNLCGTLEDSSRSGTPHCSEIKAFESAASIKAHQDEQQRLLSSAAVEGEIPVVTGVYLNGVLNALNAEKTLLDVPNENNYDSVDEKVAKQSSGLLGGIIRGIRKSIDLGIQGNDFLLQKNDSVEGSSTKGFLGELLNKIHDRLEDFGDEILESLDAKRKNSLVFQAHKKEGNRATDESESIVLEPTSPTSMSKEERAKPQWDNASSLFRFPLADPISRKEYTTDSEMSINYEQRSRRPVTKRRKSRGRFADSSSDVPNSSTNEDHYPLFISKNQRRRSQPLLTGVLSAPKPPGRTKSSSNLGSFYSCSPPQPPKRAASHKNLLCPKPPARTKSKERISNRIFSAENGPQMSAFSQDKENTSILVSPDRWRKGRLVAHRKASPTCDECIVPNFVEDVVLTGGLQSVNAKPITNGEAFLEHSIDLKRSGSRAPKGAAQLEGALKEAKGGHENASDLDQELEFQDAVTYIDNTTLELQDFQKKPATLGQLRPWPRKGKAISSAPDNRNGKLSTETSNVDQQNATASDAQKTSTIRLLDMPNSEGELVPGKECNFKQITHLNLVQDKQTKANDFPMVLTHCTGEVNTIDKQQKTDFTLKDCLAQVPAVNDNLKPLITNIADRQLGSHFDDVDEEQIKSSSLNRGLLDTGLEVSNRKNDSVEKSDLFADNVLSNIFAGSLPQATNEDMGLTGVFIPTGLFTTSEEQNSPSCSDSVTNKVSDWCFNKSKKRSLLGDKSNNYTSKNLLSTSAVNAYDNAGLTPFSGTISKPAGTNRPAHQALEETIGATIKKFSMATNVEEVSTANCATKQSPLKVFVDGVAENVISNRQKHLKEKVTCGYQQLASQGASNVDCTNPAIDKTQELSKNLDTDSCNKNQVQPLYSKTNKQKGLVSLLPPPPPVKALIDVSSGKHGIQDDSDELRDDKMNQKVFERMQAPRISICPSEMVDGELAKDRSILCKLIPTRTKKAKKQPIFQSIDPEQLAKLPTMRPATPEPSSPTKKFLTVDDPNVIREPLEEPAGDGETFTRKLIRRGSNALIGLTGSFRKHRPSSFIEGTLPAGSPYQVTVVDTTDGTALDVKECGLKRVGSSPSILRQTEKFSKEKSVEIAGPAAEKPLKVHFIASPVHGRTLKSETKPANASSDLLYPEEPSAPIKIDVTPSRRDLQFPIHGRKLKLATEGISQPIRPTEESYLFSQYTDAPENIPRGKIPDIDPRTQITGIGRGEEKRGSIEDQEFERDIFVPKRQKAPISLTRMLRGALTGKGLPWSTQLGGREWARKRQNRPSLYGGANSLLGTLQVGAAGVEARNIGREDARLRLAAEESLKAQSKQLARTVSFADIMDIRQSFRNEELARMVAGAPPDAVLAHVKASPYVDSMTMETIKKLLIPDFAKLRERIEERFRKRIPRERVEKAYQPFAFDRGSNIPREESTYLREGPLRMSPSRNRLDPANYVDPYVTALYGVSPLSTPSPEPKQAAPSDDCVVPATISVDTPCAAATGGPFELDDSRLVTDDVSGPGSVKTPCAPHNLRTRSDVTSTLAAGEDSSQQAAAVRNAHDVIREAAQLAAQPSPAPPIPPLALPRPAVGNGNALTHDHGDWSQQSALLPTLPQSIGPLPLSDADDDIRNRRSSLILTDTHNLEIARPQLLDELTAVSVDVSRVRQQLQPTFRRFAAAEV